MTTALIVSIVLNVLLAIMWLGTRSDWRHSLGDALVLRRRIVHLEAVERCWEAWADRVPLEHRPAWWQSADLQRAALSAPMAQAMRNTGVAP